MALDNIERRVVYEGDGSQKDFPFSFVVFKDSDITVSRSIDENRDETVATTEYSVELSDDGTGTVHFVEAPAEGIRIAILSAVPETQPMKLTTYDGFDPEVLNDSADRIVALIQQLLEKVQRAVILSPTDPMSANTLRDRLFQAAKEALESAQSAEEALAACEQIRQLIQLYSWDIPHVVDSLRDVEDYPYDGYFWVPGFGDAGVEGQDISNRVAKAAGSTALRPLGERFADVVNVCDFGAKGDGVADDTESIQAAIDFCGNNGGGCVYFPTGTYVVHNPAPDRTNSFNPKYFALYQPYSNVFLTGAGAGNTVLRCKTTDAAYGVLLMAVTPIENGKPQIENTAITGLTLDGNSEVFDLVSGETRTPVVYGIGLRNATFKNLVVCNSNMYGIGLENGGHQNIKVLDSVFYNCGRNAVDVKNNGSANRDIVIDNCTVINCGFGNYEAEDSKNSGIGIACESGKVTNITFVDIPTTGKLGQLIHIKANSQGTGGKNVIVSNIQAVFGDGEYPDMDSAVMVRNTNVSVSKVKLSGNAPVGIYFGQPYCTATDCTFDGVQIGIKIGNKTTTGAGFEEYDGADYCSIIGCVFRGAENGVSVARNDVKVIGNTFSSCVSGISFTSYSATKSLCCENSFENCDTTISAVSGLQSHCWFNNAGAEQSVTTVLSEGKEHGLSLNVKSFLRVIAGEKTPFAVYASEQQPDGYLRLGSAQPKTDGISALGSSSLRWSEVYAATGAISTSDERYKQDITDPDEALMRAWGKVKYRLFRFKDAVEKKGDSARTHAGLVAQQVIEAFASEGLDALRYGVVCYDKWDDEYEDVEVVDMPEVLDEKGNVISPAVTHIERRKVLEAGDRYGIRYEEADALEHMYERWERNQIKQRLAAAGF